MQRWCWLIESNKWKKEWIFRVVRYVCTIWILERIENAWTFSYNRGKRPGIRTNFSLHGYTFSMLVKPRTHCTFEHKRSPMRSVGRVEFQNSKGSMRIALKTLRMKLYLPSKNPRCRKNTSDFMSRNVSIVFTWFTWLLVFSFIIFFFRDVMWKCKEYKRGICVFG